MKEQLITFDTAKLAKEKGFEILFPDNYYVYDKNHEKYILRILSGKRDVFNGEYSAPTQSLLQKWLREEHGVMVYMNVMPLSSVIDWGYTIRYGKDIGRLIMSEEPLLFKNYEEALEKGISEALNLIKK